MLLPQVRISMPLSIVFDGVMVGAATECDHFIHCSLRVTRASWTRQVHLIYDVRHA